MKADNVQNLEYNFGINKQDAERLIDVIGYEAAFELGQYFKQPTANLIDELNRINSMVPDVKKHNTDPAYLRSLIEKAGISQREAARRIGVDERLFRMYLTDRANSTAQNCTYAVQFCLEALAYTEGVKNNEKL